MEHFFFIKYVEKQTKFKSFTKVVTALIKLFNLKSYNHIIFFLFLHCENYKLHIVILCNCTLVPPM